MSRLYGAVLVLVFTLTVFLCCSATVTVEEIPVDTTNSVNTTELAKSKAGEQYAMKNKISPKLEEYNSSSTGGWSERVAGRSVYDGSRSDYNAAKNGSEIGGRYSVTKQNCQRVTVSWECGNCGNGCGKSTLTWPKPNSKSTKRFSCSKCKKRNKVTMHGKKWPCDK